MTMADDEFDCFDCGHWEGVNAIDEEGVPGLREGAMMAVNEEPCTRRHKLTSRERLKMRSEGLCMNGCNKPIAPPSKVVCRDCLDAMGKELAAILAKMEAR